MFKLIVVICAFAGAFVLALVAAQEGLYNNTSVITLDNGFVITKACLIAAVVALLAFRLRTAK